MLGLYPFAPSIFNEPVFHSPFDLMDDDFGWPITTRRYVLPRRRYVHRRSPYDIDTLIDHMAGLTSLDDHELTPTNTESGKSRRRSPRRNAASPKHSPRRALNTEAEAKTEEKSDVNMASASADSKETEVKTAEPSTASTAASSAPTGETPASSSSPNTKVATTETATAPAATDNSTNSVSPFRLIKQLNGLNLTVTSSDTAYNITTPVPPSINKSDLQLSVDNYVVTLSAQIKSTQKNAKGTTESSSSVYINRSVRLNRDANTDGIGAHFSDGNLTITVPRIPSEKKQTINIE